MKKSMVFEGIVAILLILLIFLMLAMLLGVSPPKEVSGIGDINYTYASNDNTLYVLSDNTIRAIDGSGTQNWTFTIPGQWSVCYYGYYPGIMRGDSKPQLYQGNPIMSSGNGILYVYVKPARPGPSSYYLDGALMAISGGSELWEVPITGHNVSYPAWWGSDYLSDPWQFSDTVVYTGGDNVYVFHDYNETAIGANGTVLWNIGNVTDPMSVDDAGFAYGVHSVAPLPAKQKYPYSIYLPDYREPSGTIDAFYPNGTLYWERQIETPLARQSMAGDMLPLYNNGIVYAPMNDGITALYANGTTKWTKIYDGTDFKFDWQFDPGNLTESQQSDINAFNEGYFASRAPSPQLPVENGVYVSLGLYGAMPFDSEGNVYLQCTSDIPTSSLGYAEAMKMFLITIGPAGNETSRNYINEGTYAAARDGIGYATGYTMRLNSGQYYGAPSPSSITDLPPDELSTFDVKTGKALWNHTFTTSYPTVITLDMNNVRSVIDSYQAQEAINNVGRNATEISGDSYGSILPLESLLVSPGNGVVYVSFQSMNYEYPVVLGKSKCAYVGGIYEFDENGTMLWYKPTPPISNTMQVTGNGTIFYQTPDGKVGVTGAGFAGGFTLTALLYLFLRFFCIGAVARAKARLNQNDNRNRVYDFIVKNPGSTLYEASRGTDMNIGTVRYHLFILGLNHKIVSSRMDGKYIRHFTNSNTYSKEEQLILSLVKRGTLGKILAILIEKPGISNVQISRELGITESEVSRYVGELAEKGLVTKALAGKDRAYTINESKREGILSVIKRLDGP